MAAFLGGYALVWSAFGALAFAMDAGLHAAVEASPWLHEREWAIGGSVLALAGAFQFTSLKDACLDKCRHPAQFLMRYYERGVGGGFRLGARHGTFCVGCCWALMLVMFAAGVASLVWMALLTTLMVHEKTRPAGRRAVPVTGVALLGLSSVVLLYSAYAAASVVAVSIAQPYLTTRYPRRVMPSDSRLANSGPVNGTGSTTGTRGRDDRVHLWAEAPR